MRTFQAVFLDAGFTLIHLRRPWADLVLEVVRGYGADHSPQEVQRAEEIGQSFFYAHYYRPNNTWTHDAEILGFWTEYFRRILDALNLPPALALPCAQDLARLMNRPDQWQPFPEVVTTLTDLKAAGYTVGVLSDWSSDLPAILEALGLCQHIDFLVVSAIEGVAKTQPAFFQLALERAGVPATQALMVGDNLYGDIQGAAQVGIRGLLIDRHAKEERSGVPTISRLDDIWGYLD